ncbi:hypothetical protein I4U23_003652 [Adineta vaga]|nr:hypothetical protein I4U23_003652 [Adineta vaga]
MAHRVTPEQVNVESKFSNIFRSSKAPKERTSMKAMPPMYTQIKQMILDETIGEEDGIETEEQAQQNWQDIVRKLNDPPYKVQKKEILEKLDEEDNYAALHYAVLSNKLFFCQELIENFKCNVNLIGNDGQTPLHLAASLVDDENNTEIVTITIDLQMLSSSSVLQYLLMQPDINIYSQDNQKRTALHHAIMQGRIENAKAIIKKDKSIRRDKVTQSKSIFDLRDIQGALPIHYACQFYDSTAIFELFDNEHYEWFNEETYDKKRPIDIAAEHGHLDILKNFLQNMPNYPGIETLVHAAVRHRNGTVVSFLQNQPFSFPDNILHAACRERDGHKSISCLKITHSLLKKRDSDGYTPLMIAVKHRRFECVKALLDTKLCTDDVFSIRTENRKRTVLHICAEIQQQAMTEIIFKALNNVDKKRYILTQKDATGDTPLHICAQKGNVYMGEKLLELYKTLPRSHPGKIPIWHLKNYNKLIPFQEAISNNQLKIVESMLRLIPESESRKKMIHATDTQFRTNLHLAAVKGNPQILKLLIDNELDSNALDMDNNSPLHYAVSWDNGNEESVKDRIECIDHLIHQNVDVDALNIRRDTPLHNASRYGSSKLVKSLLNHNADLLLTNRNGLNCLEVAIEEHNEEIVKYFIEHDRIFELMRNAQIQPRKFCFIKGHMAGTPMRKLIEHMPDMALLILEKCTIDIGGERIPLHNKIYNYEFLDDQYFINTWIKDNFVDEKGNNPTDKIEDKVGHINTYTRDVATIVENYPLRLMAKHNRTHLMAHPLSQSLANRLACSWSCWIFSAFFLLYCIFLSLFTLIAVRVQHPQIYYNETNFHFDNQLCENVSQALENGTLGGRGTKNVVDYALKYIKCVVIVLLLLKNFWLFLAFFRYGITKLFILVFEIGALYLSGIFLWDSAYQNNVTMRCPLQWQYGTFGIFAAYIGLLYYVQYIPIIGIYFIMLKIVIIRFIFFLPVLTCLLVSFALPFYMLFQYRDEFNDFGSRSLSQIVMMMSGELDFSEKMFDEHDPMKPYYKLSYIMFVLFAIVIVILVGNLLTSLAVSEIMPLVNRAKGAQIDMKFELISDYEILRLQLHQLFCGHLANRSRLYGFRNMKRKSRLERLYKNVVHFFTYTTYIDEDMFQSVNEIEDTSGKQMKMLAEIKDELKNPNQSTKTIKEISIKQPLRLNNKKTSKK